MANWSTFILPHSAFLIGSEWFPNFAIQTAKMDHQIPFYKTLNKRNLFSINTLTPKPATTGQEETMELYHM